MRALVVAMLLASSIAHAQSVSPGPLNADHRSVDNVDGCIKCHAGGGDAVSPAGCLSCHKTLGARIAAKQGYHATVGNDCGNCHPDHRGEKAALIRWPGGAMEKFDHGKTGYALTGKHATTKCRDCHKPAFITGAVTVEEKYKTFLGVSSQCSTCHEDIHKPTLGKDCERCHDAASWQVTATKFDHGKTKFPLLGGHANVECTKCHGGTPAKLADLHPKFDTCVRCHADPHAKAMGDDRSCATCHTEVSWKDSRYDKRTHPKTLPLTAAHDIACAQCHDAKLTKQPSAQCIACHADPHKPSLGTRCEQCHDARSWTKAALPKITFHDRTAYPLRGMHVSVKCEACHDPKKPAALRYRPIAHGKCIDCHADPHEGQTQKSCETCHGVEGWKPAHFEIADHANTKFPLDGAHRAVTCVQCHPAPPKPPGFNAGNPACETCHADPHKGQFGKQLCAECHSTVAWSPSTFTKEQHAKAGLALVGKHDVACGRCHAGTFKGLSNDCGGCHDDHHVGQFANEKCTDCHAGAAWKPTPGFDHAKSFALRGRHATAACDACHPKVHVQVTAKLAIDSEVYALPAKMRECVGCHRPEHGAAGTPLAQATRACTTCHDEASWRDIKVAVLFDHATTGSPLVGGHQNAACSGCHNPTRRKVPAMAACATCHQDRHAGKLGEHCESCHSPATWKQDQLLVDHQRTRLPLVGAHAVQACSACHRNRDAGDYRGLDPTCRGCHWHTVEDRLPHPDHTKDPAFLTCENCHSVLGWRPAHVDHDKFSFALTGKHAALACTACHPAGQPFSTASKECLSCHQKDLAMANATVMAHDTYGTKCEQCHNATSWLGAKVAHPEFGIPHHAATCAQCHTTATDPAMFTCLTAGCHPQSETDSRHHGVGGYMYEPTACFRCHKGGA